jgi:hypothetical protein
MKSKNFAPEKTVGIWIDHSSASIFKINESYQYETKTIVADVDPDDINEEKKISGFRRMFLNQDKLQRRRHQHLLKYFKTILDLLYDTDYIYLFGPGNCKHEFSQFIAKHKKRATQKVMAIDAADKMTYPEMLEKVKSYFRSLRFIDAQRSATSVPV